MAKKKELTYLEVAEAWPGLKAVDRARLLKQLLLRMDRALEHPAYNLIVHTSPFVGDTTDVYHWHVEILPKLTRVAGFEWGTGFYINPTSPEEAAQVLRNVRLS